MTSLQPYTKFTFTMLKKEVFLFLGLGIISGIPFLLILSTLSFWLTELKMPAVIIGAFTLTTIPYSLKPLWAPYVDNLSIPLLGKFLDIKCSWGVLSNILLAISIVGLGYSDPQYNLSSTIFFALLVSLCASIQDIIIDTLRIELIPYHLSGVIVTMETIGFRIGMFLSGAGAIYIAEYFSWHTAYNIMGSIVIFGSFIFWLLNSSSMTRQSRRMKKVTFATETPFTIYPLLSKYKLVQIFFYSIYNVMSQKGFLSIIAFIFFFKVADSALNSMSAPFIHALGFSKIEYANISKFFGTIIVICGSIAGGFCTTRWNTLLCLKLYGYLQILSTCMFILQIHMGHNNLWLTLTLGLESFVSGFGSVGFLACLSRLCHLSFTATSFTMLCSLGSLFRIIISLTAGWCVDNLGWNILFYLVILFTIPIFYYLNKIAILLQPSN